MIYSHPLWAELELYIGEGFRPEWCNSFDAKMSEARAFVASDEEFYATTDVYLYQGVGFFLDPYKRPYYGSLFQCIGTDNVTILDYGCGCGYDGTWFLDAGLTVSFADVAGKSVDFLKHRLSTKGYAAPVYEIGKSVAVPRHDIVWCIDTLEHTKPETHADFLLSLEQLGRTVFVTLVHDKKADGKVHYPVDTEKLTAWVAQRRHSWYADYHHQPDGSFVRLLVIGERAGRLQRTPGMELRKASRPSAVPQPVDMTDYAKAMGLA